LTVSFVDGPSADARSPLAGGPLVMDGQSAVWAQLGDGWIASLPNSAGPKRALTCGCWQVQGGDDRPTDGDTCSREASDRTGTSASGFAPSPPLWVLGSDHSVGSIVVRSRLEEDRGIVRGGSRSCRYTGFRRSSGEKGPVGLCRPGAAHAPPLPGLGCRLACTTYGTTPVPAHGNHPEAARRWPAENVPTPPRALLGRRARPEPTENRTGGTSRLLGEVCDVSSPILPSNGSFLIFCFLRAARWSSFVRPSACLGLLATLRVHYGMWIARPQAIVAMVHLSIMRPIDAFCMSRGACWMKCRYRSAHAAAPYRGTSRWITRGIVVASTSTLRERRQSPVGRGRGTALLEGRNGPRDDPATYSRGRIAESPESRPTHRVSLGSVQDSVALSRWYLTRGRQANDNQPAHSCALDDTDHGLQSPMVLVGTGASAAGAPAHFEAVPHVLLVPPVLKLEHRRSGARASPLLSSNSGVPKLEHRRSERRRS
jgi:hypothetical protein